MGIRCILTALLLAALSLPFSGTVTAQAPPPTPTPPTLWSFLGIPQAYYKMRGATANRRGNHPGLEAKPPLKGIADPKNLASPFEPIKVAAEVKQAEDAAPQKIKGIKYLAKIGCGCYNKDGNKVTKAMLAGLNDCTEDVRQATVEAIADAAEGEMCANCGQRSCCSEELTLELAKLAYERDEHGCYKEPSADVRKAAQKALEICCPNQIPVEVIGQESGGGRTREPGEPTPAQPDDPAPQVPGDADPDSAGAKDATTSVLPLDGRIEDSANGNAWQTSSRRTWKGNRPQNLVETVMGQNAAGITRQVATSTRVTGGSARGMTDASLPESDDAPANAVAHDADLQRLRGTVERVDATDGYVNIHFRTEANIPVGTKLNVFHRYLLGEKHVAVVEVVHTSKNIVNARFLDRGPLAKVSRGDQVRAR